MINELRNKSNEELAKIVVKMKSKLLEYRFREASGEMEGTHKIKMAKKSIAIALTVLRERNVKLSLSSHDHALIMFQEGKQIIKSFKPKGSSSIIFEEEEKKEVKLDKKSKTSGKQKNDALTNEKVVVDKKMTKDLKSKNKNSGSMPSSVIKKSTGRGQ